MPTFAEYAPEVAKSTPRTSSKTWIFYWNVLVAEWGDRPTDEPPATDINALANLVQERAAAKSESYTGAGARALFIDAVKCLYRRASARTSGRISSACRSCACSQQTHSQPVGEFPWPKRSSSRCWTTPAPAAARKRAPRRKVAAAKK